MALLPAVAGLTLLVTTLLVLNHPFNYINIVALPVIIGIGIDDGIHIIHRFRQSEDVFKVLTETGRAVVMTTLTTAIGFGSLMLSQYGGLVSLGFVLTIGTLLCLFTSLEMLPALLAGLHRPGPGRAL